MASFLSNLLAKGPLSPSSPKVGLPLSDEEMATTDAFLGASEKCEFRIEGMTCGACVEVSFLPPVLAVQCAAGSCLLF